MLTIMLCGAADTSVVVSEFATVATALGADPWHFLSGDIFYLNNASASWRANSARSVAAADVVVFVVVRQYGEVSWTTELRQAVDDGTPFVILCLTDTYRSYLAAEADRPDPAAAVSQPIDPRLADTMRELERTYSFTIVQFDDATFSAVLRRELAKVFVHGIQALTSRARRESLASLLGNPDSLTAHDLHIAREVALDEFEDKRLRKAAITALAHRDGLDEDSTLSLVRSSEQGVARLSVELLDRLYRQRPPAHDFLAEIIDVAGDSDDVALSRRLVHSLFRLSLEDALAVACDMHVSDVGIKRRLVDHIETNLEAILASHELRRAAELVLGRCLAPAGESPWKDRATAMLATLGS